MSVHSRPERRPSFGPTWDKDLKWIMLFIVGRVASAAIGRALASSGRRIAADAQFAAPTMNYYASAASSKLVTESYCSGISNVSLPFRQRPHAAEASEWSLRSLAKSAACGQRAADGGRRNAADYEQHNSFQVFISGRAEARPTLRPTMNRHLRCTCYLFSHVACYCTVTYIMLHKWEQW